MDRTLLSETLCELYLEETGAPVGVLSDQMRLDEDLGLDSVDQINLIMQVERHFRIRFSIPELRQIQYVGDLLALVQLRLAELTALRAA